MKASLANRSERMLTAQEFHQLAAVPVVVEWFANIENPRTRRAYEIDRQDFMAFVGISAPEEFRIVTLWPSTKAGLQRFTWDLHYARPTDSCALPISATPYSTKCEPEGPRVMPGAYTARLTVDGTVHTKPFEVRMDPRVKTSLVSLRQQHDLSVALYDAILEARVLADSARAQGKAEFAGNDGFGGVASAHQGVIDVLQDSDAPATAMVMQIANQRLAAYAALKRRWVAARRE